MTFRTWLTFTLAAVSMAGCQKLKYENNSIEIFPFGVHRIEFDAPKYNQKLSIEAHSPGSPISVYLVSQAESDAAQDQLEKDKTPTASLASMEKAEEIKLEATVPANTAFVLLIRADKKSAQVRVNVSGR